RHEEPKKLDYHYEGGIQSYVKYLNENRDLLYNEPIFLEGEDEGISIEVALQHTDSYHTNLMSFANNIHTYEGGMHVSGFKTALTRTVNDYARNNNLLIDLVSKFSGDDVYESITIVLSV